MKIASILFILSCLTASAQLAITNTVKVALSTNDDNALHLAWRLDSNSRTNGLAPYGVQTNALTYSQYQDFLATEAFQSIARQKSDENLTQVIQLYRQSTDADRAKVARILGGLAQ